MPVLPLPQNVPCPHSWSWCSCQSSLWWLTETGRWLLQPRFQEASPWPISHEKKTRDNHLFCWWGTETFLGSDTVKPPSNIQEIPCPALEVAQQEHTTWSLVWLLFHQIQVSLTCTLVKSLTTESYCSTKTEKASHKDGKKWRKWWKKGILCYSMKTTQGHTAVSQQHSGANQQNINSLSVTAAPSYL